MPEPRLQNKKWETPCFPIPVSSPQSACPFHPEPSKSVKPLRGMCPQPPQCQRSGSRYICTFACCLSGCPMAESSEGASNSSFLLNLMSKTALPKGQEKVGVCTACCRHHGQAVTIMKKHHETSQIRSCSENVFPVEFVRKEGSRCSSGPGGCIDSPAPTLTGPCLPQAPRGDPASAINF